MLKNTLSNIFIYIFICTSMVFSKDLQEGQIGRYQIDVTTYMSKKGNIFVLETTLDTKTGKVVKRERFYHTNYGKKKK